VTQGEPLRWDELFGDLERQWEAEQRRELDAEVADRTRRERATVTLRDRLAASGARVLALDLVHGSVIGVVADVGDGWVLVRERLRGTAVLPFAAVVSVTGLPARAVVGESLARSFGFGYVLRGLSRDRAVVALTDVSGRVLTGTVDAVGADVLELAEHAPDLPRREENLTRRRLVPFSAVVVLRQA
jgi:hypothetical protein